MSVDEQTAQSQRQESQYYRYSPEEEGKYLGEGESEDSHKEADSESKSRHYSNVDGYLDELEFISELSRPESEQWVSEMNLRLGSKSESRHKLIGTCTAIDYKKWYFEYFPDDCKYLFNAASSHYYSDLLYSLYCSTECGAAYSMFLRSCGDGGKQLAQFYASLCWTNERGLPCFLFLGRYQKSNPITRIETCLSSVDGRGCSLECKDTLELLTFTLGCCVANIYNTTVLEHGSQYQLWSSCGVTVPDYCKEPYSRNEVSGGFLFA